MHTISSRDFNRESSRALRLSAQSPVLITKHGKPQNVLLSYADYQKLANGQTGLWDAFANGSPDAADAELTLPPRSRAQRRDADWDE